MKDLPARILVFIDNRKGRTPDPVPDPLPIA
jgi:hypothetical protein